MTQVRDSERRYSYIIYIYIKKLPLGCNNVQVTFFSLLSTKIVYIDSNVNNHFNKGISVTVKTLIRTYMKTPKTLNS